MKRWKVFSLLLLLLAAALAAALIFMQSNCPLEGSALTQKMRAFVRLKNRTGLPQQADFDGRVTLAALLQPGEDRSRWSASRAAAIEGYVVGVSMGGIEAANCYSLNTYDTHIHLALRPDAPRREQVVVEITPRMRERAKSLGLDWSELTLRRELPGRWCRFEGWLLFDEEHANESENTAPGVAGNWRATAWEIHPVTHLKVMR
ncbi:MAG TPA: hypothetical protein VF708_06970 [Pyrinomonadaceae bacterium]